MAARISDSAARIAKPSFRALTGVLRRCVAAASVALGLALLHAAPAIADGAAPRAGPSTLSIAHASPDTRRIATWVISTNDNHGLPFLIVDKINAQVLAFNRQGGLIGAAPVLLGLARGDDSPPDIGALPLSGIAPEERITPAGRFVAARGVNADGKDILWVDYGAAISLHPVILGKVSDHRLHRLATPTTRDNRISFGCINVPVIFYQQIVRPLFNATTGIVYILPETRPIEDVFSTPSPQSHFGNSDAPSVGNPFSSSSENHATEQHQPMHRALFVGGR